MGHLIILLGQMLRGRGHVTRLYPSTETCSERGALTCSSETLHCSSVEFNLMYALFKASLYHQFNEFVSKTGCWLQSPCSSSAVLSCCLNQAVHFPGATSSATGVVSCRRNSDL